LEHEPNQEKGHVKIEQKNLQLDFTLKGLKVFARSNDIRKLSKPLLSRFRRLHLPKYTKKQFLDVGIKVCSKLSEETAIMIGQAVWKSEGSIRDVIFINKILRKTISY
jgi:hypothetical protein